MLFLQLKAEKDNAEVRLNDPAQYQAIVDAEWNIIYEKLDKCVQTGAKVWINALQVHSLSVAFLFHCATLVYGLRSIE